MISQYGARAWLANAALLGILAFLTAAPAQARPIRILVLGDSLTAGYGLTQPDGFQAVMQAALRSRGLDVTLLDAAVSGDTTAGGRARLDWALADGAEAALVELGANDALRGTSPANMEANLAAILDTLAARKMPVLLSGMLAPPNLGPEYGDAYKAVFARLGRRPGVLFDPFFLQGIAGEADLNQGDRIHPNPQGVRQEVARLLPLMVRLVAMASQVPGQVQ
jgi:acyl-CoA thioesterase-1